MKDDILYIVMPAYNEQDNIDLVVKQWHPVIEKIGNGSKLVIVDDGSKDETYFRLCKLVHEYPLLEPLTKSNAGHGSTCLYAYTYAINARATYIFQTDSDGQTDPNEFWQFWDKRNEFDFVIGIRKNRQDGFSRVIITKTLKFVVRFIFKERVADGNTPFRLMNAQKLKPILQLIPKDFFLSNVLISTIVVKLNEKVCWIPISFKQRQGGVNSINIKHIIKIGIKALKDFKDINENLK